MDWLKNFLKLINFLNCDFAIVVNTQIELYYVYDSHPKQYFITNSNFPQLSSYDLRHRLASIWLAKIEWPTYSLLTLINTISFVNTSKYTSVVSVAAKGSVLTSQFVMDTLITFLWIFIEKYQSDRKRNVSILVTNRVIFLSNAQYLICTVAWGL